MRFKKSIIGILIVGLFFATSFALGVDVELLNPLRDMNNISDVLDAVAKWMLDISLVLAPLMFVVGGIMFTTAHGDATKISNAKKLMFYTVVGIIVVLLAESLIGIFKGFVSTNP